MLIPEVVDLGDLSTRKNLVRTLDPWRRVHASDLRDQLDQRVASDVRDGHVKYGALV